MGRESKMMLLNKLLNIIEEYEKASGDEVKSISFNVEKSEFKLYLKEETNRLN